MYNYSIGYWTMEAVRNITLTHVRRFSSFEIKSKVVEAANTVIEESMDWQEAIKPGLEIRISDVYPFAIDILIRDHGFKTLDCEAALDEYDFVVREGSN